MMTCEAKIDRFPDNTLGENGLVTRTVCQRCEIFLMHTIRNQYPRSIEETNNSVNVILQNCPKLLDEGFIAGYIPSSLLPKLKSS